MSRIFLVIAIVVLAGCSGLSDRVADHTSPPLGLRLPAPATLHGASFTAGERSVTADQYETAFPNSRVQVSGTSLQFVADSAMASPADLAFAMYELDGTGYSGQGLLGIDWQGSAPGNGVYVGIANWAANQWEWQPTPPTEEIDLGVYSDYVQTGTGHILITVLSTRIQTMTLDEVHFGTPGLESPTGVTATDGDFPDKVNVMWTAPATGPAPTGYSIWRSDTQGGAYAQVGTVAGVTTYDDATVAVDTTYWYKVKSTKSGEPDSAFSAENDGVATAGGVGWTISPATGVAVDPIYLSLALVNGKPAVAYGKNAAGYELTYVHAQDSAGTAWNGKVSLGTGWQEPCVGFFGGVPGISFAGPLGDQKLMYRNGADADGTTFNPEITLFDGPAAHLVGDPDMLVVNGNPGIAYRYLDLIGGTGTELDFIRANDGLGNNWPATHVVIDSGEEAWNPQLAILSNGFPCVAFNELDKDNTENSKLMYTRANSANGTSWATPIEIYQFGSTSTLAPLQLLIANGQPAVAFSEGSNSKLYYKRANNADGSDWPLGATELDASATFYDGATTVNGKPAVVFTTGGGLDLKYKEAVDTSGNSWLPAALIESAPTGIALPTMQAFGTPTEHACVAYVVKGVEVRYARKN